MRIDLVTGCDGDFARHLAAMLLSLTETNPQHDFAVSVLWNGSASDRLKFERVLQGTPFSYSLIDISADDTLAGLTVSADMLHVTKMTYARLLVGALLPPKIDRVLYLDGDIIVRGDIGPLWTTDLGGKTAGAVIDLPHYARKSTLGLPPDAPYFNAGVLLIDLERWRRLKIGERAAEFARDHWDRMQWGDQCALNFVLQDDWKVLDSQIPEPHPMAAGPV